MTVILGFQSKWNQNFELRIALFLRRQVLKVPQHKQLLLFGNKKTKRVINIQKVIETLVVFTFSQRAFGHNIFFFLILVPFNFVDADERNANVDKKLKLSNF